MGTERYYPVDEFGKQAGKAVTVHTDDGRDDASAVPEGSISKVREWVGYDPNRAKAALLVEHARDEPRKGLLEALEPLVKESR